MTAPIWPVPVSGTNPGPAPWPAAGGGLRWRDEPLPAWRSTNLPGAAAVPHVTLLFDEIDAGVSGRVSGAIAALLRRLAQANARCLRHPPALVAAAADHHFQVRNKQVEDGRTLTRVSHLRGHPGAAAGTGRVGPW